MRCELVYNVAASKPVLSRTTKREDGILGTTDDISTTASASLGDYVSLLRPTQWVKNVVVFSGPAAGLKLLAVDSFLCALTAFAVFCLAASGSYAINDTVDREADARHPTKRFRPVARGAIRPVTAWIIGVILILAGVSLAWATLGVIESCVVSVYVVMTLAYSFALKRRMILDVIIIAIGFVLRTLAGSLAVDVVTSKWLIACMFTLCLFLGFGKRRCEQALIGDADQAGQHRRTLLRYTPDLLNHLITVSAGIAIITFLLYTLDTSGMHSPFPKEHLFYTLPIVVYGIFRYAMLTEAGIYGGPTEIVLKDKPLLAAIVVWAFTALGVAYQNKLLGPGGLTELLGVE